MEYNNANIIVLFAD